VRVALWIALILVKERALL
jgi:hypothetical protein